MVYKAGDDTERLEVTGTPPSKCGCSLKSQNYRDRVEKNRNAQVENQALDEEVVLLGDKDTHNNEQTCHH